MEKRLIKESVLCYAAHLGSTPIVEALIEKCVGKKFCNENRNISVEISRLSFGLHHHTQSAVLLNFC